MIECSGVELHRIIAALSTLYSGFFALVRRGEISHRIMGNGVQFISDLFVGGEKESGENCWIF